MLVNVEPSPTNRSTGVIVWDFPPAVVLRVDVFVFVKEQASVVVGGDTVSPSVSWGPVHLAAYMGSSENGHYPN